MTHKTLTGRGSHNKRWLERVRSLLYKNILNAVATSRQLHKRQLRLPPVLQKSEEDPLPNIVQGAFKARTIEVDLIQFSIGDSCYIKAVTTPNRIWKYVYSCSSLSHALNSTPVSSQPHTHEHYFWEWEEPARASRCSAGKSSQHKTQTCMNCKNVSQFTAVATTVVPAVHQRWKKYRHSSLGVGRKFSKSKNKDGIVWRQAEHCVRSILNQNDAIYKK